MKYEKEFGQYSRADFIKMLVRLYEIKPQSAKRTWNKYNVLFGNKKIELKERNKKPKKDVVQKYSTEYKEELTSLKLLEFQDMLRLLPRSRITRKFLRQYGFRTLQINWLIDAGYDIIDDMK
jgi:hypothetical protein